MTMHEQQPITPERLCAALNRFTGGQLAPREIVLVYREWRWVAQLPGEHIAFVADTTAARQRLARERRLLQLLAERASFQVPLVEWVDPHGHWDIRRKVPGDAGDWSGTHHRRIVEYPAIAYRAGQRLGEILAEWHRVITWEEARHLAPPEPPLATSLARMRRLLARGIVDATLQAQVREVFGRFDALEVGDREVVLVHGDVASQNIAFAPETSEVLGLYDFADMACADRHWEFKYLSSYPVAFQQALLDAYQRGAGMTLEIPRITLYHALAALWFLAWRVEDPEAHDRLSGRDQAGAEWWVRQVIAQALQWRLLAMTQDEGVAAPGDSGARGDSAAMGQAFF